MFFLVTIEENVVFWFFDFRPLRVPNGATKFWEIMKLRNQNALGQGSSDTYNFFVFKDNWKNSTVAESIYVISEYIKFLKLKVWI